MFTRASRCCFTQLHSYVHSRYGCGIRVNTPLVVLYDYFKNILALILPFQKSFAFVVLWHWSTNRAVILARLVRSSSVRLIGLVSGSFVGCVLIVDCRLVAGTTCSAQSFQSHVLLQIFSLGVL